MSQQHGHTVGLASVGRGKSPTEIVVEPPRRPLRASRADRLDDLRMLARVVAHSERFGVVPRGST